MRKILEYLDQIDDEIESAKGYAETYLEYKVDKTKERSEEFATKYKSMAEDEIRHAAFLHDVATMRVSEVSEVYTLPVDVLNLWEKSHHKYIEKIAWIKQMLEM